MNTLRTLPVLFLLAAGLAPLAPLDSQAGPILRRAQERKACQEFAGKLQAAGQASAINQQPVGTGPFELKRYQKDSQIL